MKKVMFVIISLMLGVGLAWGNGPEDLGEEGQMSPQKSQCRKYPEIVSEWVNCKDCHLPPNMALLEIRPEQKYDPPYGVTVREVQGEIKISALVGDISSTQIENLFDYARTHDIKHVVVEIHSPGGSLFDAWRIVGLFQGWESEGGIVETRCYGFAASAGFLIFSSGTIGHRYVSSVATIMWHELLEFAMFKMSTPSSKEDEAIILRGLQNTANWWLANRCEMTKEEIDAAVHRKEFWINGGRAHELGFSDHIIGEGL